MLSEICFCSICLELLQHEKSCSGALVRSSYNSSFFCEIIVDHAGSVLIRALQGGLDFAHHQEISPVFRDATSLYLYQSKIILFVSTTEINVFLANKTH